MRTSLTLRREAGGGCPRTLRVTECLSSYTDARRQRERADIWVPSSRPANE